ncbi:MAG: hypothetical protein ACOC3G_07665, partial [Phycisphaeraceae bacterium]
MPRRLAGMLHERRSGGLVGAALLVLIAGACFATLPWSLERYESPNLGVTETDLPPRPPSVAEPMGSDGLGRSLLWRVLLGGA